METNNDGDTQLQELLLEYHGNQKSSDSNEELDEDIINTLCRTCLKKSPDVELQSMFEQFTFIPAFLMSFAAVEKPLQGDGLSEFICTNCIDQVNETYNFRKQIEAADMELRQVIKECNSDEDGLIEEQLVTEDYTNLDDLDMEDILSCRIPFPLTSDENIIESETKEIKISSHVCINCQAAFETSEILETHLNQCHPTNLKCKHCKETFTHEFDYNLHQSLHSNSYVCTFCKKDCKDRKSQRRHIAIHFKDKPFKCSECSQQFAEQASLTRHRKKQHLGVQRIKKFHCDSCQQQFYDKYTLEVHIRAKHTLVKPFSCSQCDKSFVDKRLLKSHLKIHSDTKNYVCDLCSKAFKHQSTLVLHMRNHSSDRPFKCEICNISFKQRSTLNSHVLMHTGVKPYVCKICEKRFTASSSLKTHERSHVDQKPFQCEICKKKFARKDLRAHYATHTNQKDFSCPEMGCDKAYATQSLLNTHRKIKHSDENPFVCTQEGCKRKFSSEINLQKHLKAHARAATNQQSDLELTISQHNLFNSESSISFALSVMDELDQFMKQNQTSTTFASK
ncbi:gastrula zinc finger protein XlCGF57.1-like [Culicoides brevitarsis]|uniref:gastrula zinc finger protein XlCGF57.1-like n=1 Tax=Culicoides brevitarsis TaxID=469753 RepID=UPI00307C2E98